MKIDMNVSGNGLSLYDLSRSKIFKNNSAQASQPEIFKPKDHTAVKLTLSEDGIEAYRSYLKKQTENDPDEKKQFSATCPDLTAFDEEWKLHSVIKPMLTGSRFNWVHIGKPSDILKEYASLYDEIVQGYQDGTREKYIEDADAEDGLRRATLEDELTFLNEDFDNCLIAYEKQEERNAVFRPVIIKIARQLEKSGMGHLEFVGKAKKLESEPVAPLPDNFVEKMHTAAKEFASQYMMRFSQQGSVDVSKLLSDVATIHLDFLKKNK